MDCTCTLQYDPVCVGTLVFSNLCFAACYTNETVTGWYNDNGPAGTHACSDYRPEGEYCEGFTMPEDQDRCDPKYHCVNTMGQHIADNPGICTKPCINGTFDHYGNCIPDDCRAWYDGCNNCFVQNNGFLTCTEIFCDNIPPGNATCMDDTTCDDVACPVCNYGNKTLDGKCCGCYEEPPMCCLAMTPSCLACSSGQNVDEWCLSNQDSEWYSEECDLYIPKKITTKNIRSICENNPVAVNCEGIQQNDDGLDPKMYIAIISFVVILFVAIPFVFRFARK